MFFNGNTVYSDFYKLIEIFSLYLIYIYISTLLTYLACDTRHSCLNSP